MLVFFVLFFLNSIILIYRSECLRNFAGKCALRQKSNLQDLRNCHLILHAFLIKKAMELNYLDGIESYGEKCDRKKSWIIKIELKKKQWNRNLKKIWKVWRSWKISKEKVNWTTTIQDLIYYMSVHLILYDTKFLEYGNQSNSPCPVFYCYKYLLTLYHHFEFSPIHPVTIVMQITRYLLMLI